jgi:capsular polysaccharide transport system permease protein
VAEARRTSGYINPDQGQNGPVNATQSFIAQLNERDSQLKGQIAAITAQLQNPDAPQVQLLRQQLAANEQQLRTLNGSIKARGTSSIADSVTQFEALQNRLRDYQAVLKQAINTLGATQAAAQSQRVYMTTYVKPTLPEAPLEPRRWVDMLIIVIAAAMAWAVGRLVENSIMEHG